MPTPPPALLHRLGTALRASRLIRPVIATYTDGELHYAAFVHRRTVYVAKGPHALTPQELAAAVEVPLYSLPIPVAVDLADAIAAHEERCARRVVIVAMTVGEA